MLRYYLPLLQMWALFNPQRAHARTHTHTRTHTHACMHAPAQQAAQCLAEPAAHQTQGAGGGDCGPAAHSGAWTAR
eukprot:1144044-Pelagomonas_calceolata.AAC.8